jgi:mRNA interferase MazF
MVVAQGHVYWANLPDPTGSGPGFCRPVLVVQGDALNRSRIRSVVFVPLTSNLRWAEAPGNVLLPARTTGLPKDSVANASQIITLDREYSPKMSGSYPNAT